MLEVVKEEIIFCFGKGLIRNPQLRLGMRFSQPCGKPFQKRHKVFGWCFALVSTGHEYMIDVWVVSKHALALLPGKTCSVWGGNVFHFVCHHGRPEPDVEPVGVDQGGQLQVHRPHGFFHDGAIFLVGF